MKILMVQGFGFYGATLMVMHDSVAEETQTKMKTPEVQAKLTELQCRAVVLDAQPRIVESTQGPYAVLVANDDTGCMEEESKVLVALGLVSFMDR